MGEFICKLGNEAGEIIEKRFAAENKGALKRDLESRGFYIFNIRPAAFTLLPGGKRGKIKQDDFIVFAQEFKALLKAGLPALQGLDILIQRQGESELGRLLQDVREDVLTGASLSDAFADRRAALPDNFVPALVAGERSGELDAALQRFIELSKLTSSLRKSFKKALYYPIFLIILSTGVLTIMFAYVLPEFSKFYEGFHEKLPAFTVAVLAFSHALQDNALYILVAFALLLFAFFWWRGTERGSKTLARLKLKFPIAGDIIHKYQLSQLFHSLASMLHGGMPLVSSLADLERSAPSTILAEDLRLARKRVSEGESLHKAIAGTMLAKDLAAEMIEVGESTGALSEMLSSVATFYDEDVQSRLGALLSLVEPVMLVVMAAIIGTLLFAMYYPLFNLLGKVGA
jgi:type IV pilus assembly protein PilC